MSLHHRHLEFSFTLCLLAILFSTAVGAATVEWSWRIDPQLAGGADERSILLQLENSLFTTEVAGQPALPLQPMSLVIPAGEKVVAVRLANVVTEEIELPKALPLFSGSVCDDGSVRSLPEVRGAFPADFVMQHGTFTHRGISSAEIILAPWRYETNSTGTHLTRMLAADIIVETARDLSILVPLRQSERDIAASRSTVARRVVNPERVFEQAPQSLVRDDRGVFNPRALPSIDGSGVDLVIVCDQEHLATLQELVDFKNSIGIATVIRDIDWIRANYPHGADLQETIRFFLQDAYVKWGIGAVLLAGDVDVIPARYIFSYFKEPPELVPCEMYYSQMDGNWNGDGDHLFGEAPYDGAEGDDVDILADVILGRLPILSVDDAQLMVDKIISYSTAPDPDYVLNSVHLGEVLFPATWQIGDPENWITRNGADYCETVIENYAPDHFNPTRFYETYWQYDDALPELLPDVLEYLNTEAHIIQHVGHGYRYTMSVGSGSIVSDDAMHMTNGLNQLQVLYMLNCTSCAVDYKSLGETFLLAPEGGSIASMGTTREAFPNTSIYYQNAFFESLFADSTQLGEVFEHSRRHWSHLALAEGSHRWTQMIYVLIGDPTINIWEETPRTLSVALTEPFDLDSESLSLLVTTGGEPVENAKIIAAKAGEDRAVGYTDAAGTAVLDINADSVGKLEINIVSRNDYPLFTQIDVLPGSAPRLSVAGIRVLDDPSGGDPQIAGNADGRLDAGETVRLGLRIHNRGNADADNVTLDLSVPGGQITLLETTLATGANIVAGDSLDIEGLLLDTGWDQFDGISLPLNLDLTHDGGVQSDAFDLAYHRAKPVLLSFEVDDSAGNGDGEPDAGETYTLIPNWQNCGSAPLEGWQAELTAVDPAGQVISGTVALPELALLEVAASAGFELLETEVGAPNRFALELTSPLGGSMLDTLFVRRPATPPAPNLNASFASTIIDLTWSAASGGSPAAGYLVYRSEVEGGPYERVVEEPTRHCYFRSDGLQESTFYYFVIEAVDSCGFRSGVSPESVISTNPAMLSGWPLLTGGSSASSVAIGDIDGDGDKELVCGSSSLYAWHHDGNEVYDGDENPGTHGVLNSVHRDFTASITLADVDTMTPGLEIIAASTDPRRLCVYNNAGEILPNWDKEMPHWIWATPSAADVDGDGLVEIFAPCLNGNLYAWNSDGTDYLPDSGGIFASGLGGWVRSSASLAQLDADPELEIVIGSSVDQLQAWNHDGTVLDGFPVHFDDDIYSSPSIADINDDGLNEIIFLCDNDSLYVVNCDGSLYGNGFPIFLESNSAGLAPSPAIVDFEDDGQLEIVAAGVASYHSATVTVVDNQGNTLPGWPIHIEDSSEASPVVSDLDNDGALEVLLGSEAGFLYGWEMTGVPMTGFPILTEAEIRGTPTLDDIDADYSVDLALLGWDAFVYIWDIPAFYHNGMAQWRMFRANPARTGVFTREEQTTGVDDEIVIAPNGRLFANFPNPFNPTTEIALATPTGSSSLPVKLNIYDVQGRLVRNLFNGKLAHGIKRSFTWNGKSNDGLSVGSGIYFSRVEMGDQEFSQKMVLLK
ncbi:MAG: T9SS type A sorting domain-containing protein [bacterium]|nr:T9SS type A sorting domain-containing protein [bacterium]